MNISLKVFILMLIGSVILNNAAIGSVSHKTTVGIGDVPMVNKSIYHGWGFDLIIEKDITVVKESPVEDFDIYIFSRMGRKLMFVYAGNHPEFPKALYANATKKTVLFGGFVGECIEWKTMEEDFARECLVTLDEGIETPNYIHLWYSDLSVDEKKRADKIIDSIKPCRVSNAHRKN